MSRVCTKCGVYKETGCFYKDKKTKLGISEVCKACQKILYYKYTKKEFKRKDKLKGRYIINRESFLKCKYNLSLEEYNNLLVSQGSCCAICSKFFNPSSTSLCVDYDHKTGNIRGLLCMTCNRGIGLLKDSVEILEKAIKYLNNEDKCR